MSSGKKKNTPPPPPAPKKEPKEKKDEEEVEEAEEQEVPLTKCCGRCGKDKALSNFYVRSEKKKAAAPKKKTTTTPDESPKKKKTCSKKKASSKKKAEKKPSPKKKADPAKLDSYCMTCRQDYNMEYNYGLTRDEYDRMWAAQDGCCASCKQVFDLEHGPACIDHKHEKDPAKEKQKKVRKKVRALLCASCNKGLGHFNEDPRRLLQMVLYLDTYEDCNDEDDISLGHPEVCDLMNKILQRMALHNGESEEEEEEESEAEEEEEEEEVVPPLKPPRTGGKC